MNNAEKEIYSHCTYSSYAYNRDKGMTKEQLAKYEAFKDADLMEVKYQSENQPTPSESRQEQVA